MSGSSSSMAISDSYPESSSAADIELVTPDMGTSEDSNISSDEEDSSSVEFILDSAEEPNSTKRRNTFIERLPHRAFAKPSSIKARMSLNTWEADREFHESLLTSGSSSGRDAAHNVHMEEIRTTPLFSADILAGFINSRGPGANAQLLPQYGLLAQRLRTYGELETENKDEPLTQEQRMIERRDDRLFLNVNPPWSAFICGSQGSGKSHTLSCMLEAALIPSRLGKLPRPLAGMVFHYDKFSGFSSSQVCEAAYLCSNSTPVRVMVSPSSCYRMEKVYKSLPGIPENAIEVVPLYLKESQLNVERMMKLMAVSDREGPMPLYMEVVNKILRQFALERTDEPGLDYTAFKRRLDLEFFNEGQRALLQTRLQLLESFMNVPVIPGANFIAETPNIKAGDKARREELRKLDEMYEANKAALGKGTEDIWSFAPGSLTIVDLSCPFVDESAACALFNICIAIFLEGRGDVGRIVALDEAHKYMSDTKAANTFTESLIAVIRQQRHLATRVIIATQEPTISPKLLELSSMTIVHRFTSPNWLQSLKSHLAGISVGDESSERDLKEIFETIVNLEAGQALLFSPSAMLDLANDLGESNSPIVKAKKLGLRYVKMRVRKRLTADGGRSILAA